MRSVRACSHGAKRFRGGFSLAEVVFGAGILAMFMLALPTAIRMARNAVPDGTNTASATMDAARVMELMATDIAFATSVVTTAQYDPNHLTVTVADRNGDGQPETIAYTCAAPPAGTLPAPPAGTLWFTRQYNTAAAVTLLNNVQEFGFTYDTFAVTAPPGGSLGANSQLAAITTGNSYVKVPVNPTHTYAQYVEPVLPANTTSWTLNSIQLQTMVQAVAGVATVQIRSAVGAFPSSTVLGQTTVSSFPSSINWQTIDFPGGVSGLSPYSGICIVVLTASGTACCDVQYCGNTTGTGGLLTSSDGGNIWTRNTAQDLQFIVTGQADVAGGAGTTTYYLKDVRCKLRTSSNITSRIVTTVRTYNQPQVPHP